MGLTDLTEHKIVTGNARRIPIAQIQDFKREMEGSNRGIR